MWNCRPTLIDASDEKSLSHSKESIVLNVTPTKRISLKSIVKESSRGPCSHWCIASSPSELSIPHRAIDSQLKSGIHLIDIALWGLLMKHNVVVSLGGLQTEQDRLYGVVTICTLLSATFCQLVGW